MWQITPFAKMRALEIPLDPVNPLFTFIYGHLATGVDGGHVGVDGGIGVDGVVTSEGLLSVANP